MGKKQKSGSKHQSKEIRSYWKDNRYLVDGKVKAPAVPHGLSITTVFFNIANAVPDFFIAYFFIRAVNNPAGISYRSLRLLGLMVLMEFIVLVFSFLSIPIILSSDRKRKRIALILAFGLLLTPFTIVFKIDFRTMTPLYIFWGLIINRVLFVFMRNPKEINPMAVAYSVLLYIGSIFAGIVLASTIMEQQFLQLPSDRTLAIGPVLVAGMLYYVSTGLMELFLMPPQDN